LQGPNNYTVKNITFQNNGAYPYCGIVGSGPCVISTLNTASNAIGLGVFNPGNGAQMFVGNHTYSGSCWAFWYAAGAGSQCAISGTHTFSTSVSVNLASAYAISGTVDTNNVTPATFVNPSNVNGTKWIALLNGIAGGSGTGVNYFPGNSAGFTQSGGQYAT
jgi:hypothetical protein